MKNSSISNTFDIVAWWQETGGDWANLAIFISAFAAIALYVQTRHQALVKETLKYINLPSHNEPLRAANQILQENLQLIRKTGFNEMPAKIRDAMVLVANHYEVCGFMARKKLFILEDYLEVTMFPVSGSWTLFQSFIAEMRVQTNNPALYIDFEGLASKAATRISLSEEGR